MEHKDGEDACAESKPILGQIQVLPEEFRTRPKRRSSFRAPFKKR